jgi:hypothetical protein
VIAAHGDAVKSLLASLPNLYDGQVPDPPALPYWVLYLDTSVEGATQLCATSNRADFRFQITSVGLTAEAVRIVAGRARGLVIDQRLTVPGRACGLIRHETSIPVRADRDVTLDGAHPMFAVDTYRFVSYAS